jgi:hypothetical protein
MSELTDSPLMLRLLVYPWLSREPRERDMVLLENVVTVRDFGIRQFACVVLPSVCLELKARFSSLL